MSIQTNQTSPQTITSATDLFLQHYTQMAPDCDDYDLLIEGAALLLDSGYSLSTVFKAAGDGSSEFMAAVFLKASSIKPICPVCRYCVAEKQKGVWDAVYCKGLRVLPGAATFEEIPPFKEPQGCGYSLERLAEAEMEKLKEEAGR